MGEVSFSFCYSFLIFLTIFFEHTRSNFLHFPMWLQAVPSVFERYCSSVWMQWVHIYAHLLPLSCTLETWEIPGGSAAATLWKQEEMPGKKYSASQKPGVWLWFRVISMLYLSYQNTSPARDGRRVHGLHKKNPKTSTLFLRKETERQHLCLLIKGCIASISVST